MNHKVQSLLNGEEWNMYFHHVIFFEETRLMIKFLHA